MSKEIQKLKKLLKEQNISYGIMDAVRDTLKALEYNNEFIELFTKLVWKIYRKNKNQNNEGDI